MKKKNSVSESESMWTLKNQLNAYRLTDRLSDDGNQFDTTFGVRYDVKTDKWKIGDSNVDLDGKDFITKGRRLRHAWLI